ncbi:MAG: hypothetical protein RR585_10065 [Coprobacillus sp.]
MDKCLVLEVRNINEIISDLINHAEVKKMNDITIRLNQVEAIKLSNYIIKLEDENKIYRNFMIDNYVEFGRK